MWQCDQSTLTLVILKIKIEKQIKKKTKIKGKIKKTKSTICELDKTVKQAILVY